MEPARFPHNLRCTLSFPFPLSRSVCLKILQFLLISPPEMVPTFHMNDFRPWAPPRKKLFSPHKSLNSPPPRTQNTARPKPYHNAPSSTLSVPKHHLPARPPAEVCMHIGANTQLCEPTSSQFQPREVSPREPDIYSENVRRRTTTPHESTPHIPDPEPDLIFRSDLQGVSNIDKPVEPPPSRGDFVEDGLSSPSLSISDDSLEKFFRLPDAPDGIPIDPVILANDGSQGEDIHLRLPAPQTDSLINLETTCSYSDRPSVLLHPSENDRDSGERPGGQNDNIPRSDHSQVHERQPQHQLQHNTNTDVFYSDDAHGKQHVSGRSKGSKRKTRESDGRASKRLQVPSGRPPRDDSFIALRSHFMSLPLDERLRFFSWLFEAALPRCMSGSSPTVCEDGDALAVSPSRRSHNTEENRRDCRKTRTSLKKCNKWSREEMDLLQKLKQDESRPWSEVARLFLEQYPGRSPGAIQVFWSTKLNRRAY